jgi:hypothetical protein
VEDRISGLKDKKILKKKTEELLEKDISAAKRIHKNSVTSSKTKPVNHGHEKW